MARLDLVASLEKQLKDSVKMGAQTWNMEGK